MKNSIIIKIEPLAHFHDPALTQTPRTRIPEQVTQDTVFSLPGYVSYPTAFGSGRGDFRVSGLTTFLVEEGWVYPQIQCIYRSLFRMQGLRPCRGGSGWVGLGWSPRWLSQPWSLPGVRGFSACGSVSGVGSGNDLYLILGNLSLLAGGTAPVVHWSCSYLLVCNQPQGSIYTIAIGKPYKPRLFCCPESQFTSISLWILHSWVNWRKDFTENHSDLCLSIWMGIILFLAPESCGGIMGPRKKAPNLARGSVSL